MILTNIRKLNHVKIKKLQIDSLKKLFTEFRLSLFLKECGFIKKRGTSIEELISIFFLFYLKVIVLSIKDWKN